MFTVLLLLMMAEAKTEEAQAMFEHLDNVVIGNDYTHVGLDLDLNNITSEVAEIVRSTEEVIRRVNEDNPKPYLAGHLNLLHAAKDGLKEAFAGLVLVLAANLPDIQDMTADQHLLYYQPDLLIEDGGLNVATLREKFNISLNGDEEDDKVRDPRQAGFLSGVLALGASIFNIFDLTRMAHRINNLEENQEHVGMLIGKQNLLTTKVLNASIANRKMIQNMLDEEDQFRHDNLQISAIHLMAAACLVLTRAVDQLTTGIQMAQTGKMSPHLIDHKVLGTIYYQLKKRVRQGNYHLVQEEALGLMLSPVSLISHPLTADGHSLPQVQLLIHVPITRTEPFRLLKYIDTPIRSRAPDLFISYDTAGFLALEGNRKAYAELDETDLNKCSSLGRIRLCPHVKVVTSGIKTCLMSLYTNDGHEKACPTKVEHGKFHIRRLKDGLYALNTLEALTLSYHYTDVSQEIREIDYPPGSYHLQLNSSVQSISSLHFTIYGTTEQSIKLQERMTFKRLQLKTDGFHLKEDHTHSHPVLTPLDFNVSDFEIPTTRTTFSQMPLMVDPIAICRAVIVTLVLMAIVGSAWFLLRRCCRRRNDRQWKRGTYRLCGRDTPSSATTVAGMKASPMHSSAPAVMGEAIPLNVYPHLGNQPLLPNPQEQPRRTINPAAGSPGGYSCGQDRGK